MQSADDAAPPDERASEVELPADALALVLRPLTGDVRTLCAAACVARAWRTAAAEPSLWAHIGPLHGLARDNLTDARLADLVARARGGLRGLNLTGIATSSLTDAGLAAALRHESHILSFAVSGKPLTGAGIAAALAGSRGRLQTLRMSGARAAPPPRGDASPTERVAFQNSCDDALVELRALLAPGGAMTAVTACEICRRMCSRVRECANCSVVFCKAHAEYCMGFCDGCGSLVCDECLDESIYHVCRDCDFDDVDDVEDVEF